MILKIAGCGVCFALLAAFLKSRGSEYGLLLSVCGGVTLAAVFAKDMLKTVDALKLFAEKYALPSDVISVMIKVLGISFIVEIACDICLDCGEAALSSKVGICGKFLMLAAAIPVFTQLGELLSSVAG